MSKTVRLKGAIYFFCPDKKKSLIPHFNFQVNLPTPKVEETLMCNFKDLKLGQEEKRILTQNAGKKSNTLEV